VLRVSRLTAGYGKLQVLREVDLEVDTGGNVAILGRNGAGKSTLMKAIANQVAIFSGEIVWEGLRLDRMRTERIVRAGVVLVPQSRGLFDEMTVTENLRVAFWGLKLPKQERADRLAEAFDLLPALADRSHSPASALSGGERQMLAIAKAVLRRPRLLLLDEPTTGLAPRVVEDVAVFLGQLRASNLSIIVTEQNVEWVLGLVDVIHVLDEGTIATTLSPKDEDVRGQLASIYLGRVDEATPVENPSGTTSGGSR
jgi:branched-chain amino acid transport system ATP-binding protein